VENYYNLLGSNVVRILTTEVIYILASHPILQNVSDVSNKPLECKAMCTSKSTARFTRAEKQKNRMSLNKEMAFLWYSIACCTEKELICLLIQRKFLFFNFLIRLQAKATKKPYEVKSDFENFLHKLRSEARTKKEFLASLSSSSSTEDYNYEEESQEKPEMNCV